MTTGSMMCDAEGDQPVIDMAALGADLALRLSVLGIVDAPRNPGIHRTESKRALLEAIAKAGGKW